MLILSLIGALLIGITLGLMGSGGSILTVPVLVYMLGRQGDLAIAESLAIVGGIAAFGVLPHARKGLVDWRTAFWFGLPGVAGAYAGALIGSWMNDALQLILFAAVMLAAAWFMFRKPKQPKAETDHKPHAIALVMLEGAAVGVLTGIVGVGGGFLIVPALVLLAGLPIHRAVATSLVVIAVKSGVAFLGYKLALDEKGTPVDWGLIAMFVGVGAVGTFLGKAVGGKISQSTLRRAFAIFLVIMGVVIMARESIRLAQTPSKSAPSVQNP